MKKFLALSLALLMILALVACNGNPPVDQTDDSTESGDYTANLDAAPDNGEMSDPIDYAWGTSDLQNTVPEPPFENWQVLESGDAVCRMECASGEPDTTVFYGKCKAYEGNLRTMGFVEADDSKDYFFKGVHSSGAKVEFKYGDGYCWLTVYAGPLA